MISPSDTLKVTMYFHEFEEGIEVGQTYKTGLSRQMLPGGAAQAMAVTAQMTQAATAAAVAGSMLMNVIMSGALAQVWGMINGMQVMVHLPAFNVNFPANALSVTSKILVVATFDIPYVNMDVLMFGAFEVEPDDGIFTDLDPKDGNVAQLTESFGQLSYGSRYMHRNLGSVFVIFIVSIIVLAVIFLLFLMKFIVRPSRRLYERMKKYFLWNFFIRLVFEATMELAFCCVLNIKYGSVLGN